MTYGSSRAAARPRGASRSRRQVSRRPDGSPLPRPQGSSRCVERPTRAHHPAPSWATWQKIINDRGVPDPRTIVDAAEPIPVVARIVWSTDGEEHCPAARSGGPATRSSPSSATPGARPSARGPHCNHIGEARPIPRSVVVAQGPAVHAAATWPSCQRRNLIVCLVAPAACIQSGCPQSRPVRPYSGLTTSGFSS